MYKFFYNYLKMLPLVLFMLGSFFADMHAFGQKPRSKKIKPVVTALPAAPSNDTIGSEQIRAALASAYQKFKGVKDGSNADYIPVLAEVPSELFGIAICTAEGKMYTIGDFDYKFSIQSMSKVFSLAQAIEDHGAAAIVDKVGVEPTGQVFNSIIAVEMKKGKESPFEINPFVNPGAIATTSLVKGADSAEKWNRILAIHRAFAGDTLGIEEVVYKSEAATNQRNRAIAALLYAYDRLYFDADLSTDIYTRQCAISVNTRDLATMAATLANGGTNPITKNAVVKPQTAAHVLSVMATCGLYDGAGTWLYKTALPAKSGVGGGIIAIVPGKFGIAAFSPRLDAAGNSIRAQMAIEDIINVLKVNPYLSSPK